MSFILDKSKIVPGRDCPFWGDLHNHNGIGYGKGSLDRSYAIAHGVGLDVARCLARHAGAGARVERTDQVDHRHQLVTLEPEPAPHLRLVLVGQQFEMLVDQLDRAKAKE